MRKASRITSGLPSRNASIKGWCFEAKAADVCESSGRFFLRMLAKAKNGKPGGRDRIAEAWQSDELSLEDMLQPAIEAGEQ